MKIVSVAEMQAIEQSADRAGLSYDAMMHYAGMGIARWVLLHMPDCACVIGLIGSGNNGGDTLIALTELSQRGVRTLAFLAKPRRGDPLLDELIKAGGAIVDITRSDHLETLEAALIKQAIVLDGILGTGLKLPIRGELNDLMGRVQRLLLNHSGTRIIAVDCPSGVDCDTGEAADVTFKAGDTLTMAAMKQGLLMHPARSYAGELHFIDIGIINISDHLSKPLPELITRDLVSPIIPDRTDMGHKGTFGTCLVIAGSEVYTGAAYLAGKAAYRSGCGLVEMGVPGTVHRSLSGQLIEAVWTVLPQSGGGYSRDGIDQLETALSRADSIVIGPGWGLQKENHYFLEKLLAVLPGDLPLLIDADGLRLLTNIDHWWTKLPDHTVLTPHPGEMSHLSGMKIEDVQSNRWSITRQFSEQWGVTLLLKGAMTVIYTPTGDGYINPISESALATAGSGDVLSGVIGGLLAQCIPIDSAAVAGAWLHGAAGIIAKKNAGSPISVTALDILDALSQAYVNAKEAG